MARDYKGFGGSSETSNAVISTDYKDSVKIVVNG
jgi:hypothetical protein